MSSPPDFRSTRVFVVGSANIDFVFGVETLPRPGETVSSEDVRLCPGGKGANQACAAARMGAVVSMIACIGSDPFGNQLLASLEAAGVNTSRMRRADRPTGCAGILVDAGGQNQIVVSPGANAELSPALALSLLDNLAPGDFVLLQLETSLETIEAVLKVAAEAGATCVLDPAPVRPLSKDLVRLVQILTPNQSEAAGLLGRSRPIETYEEAVAAARELTDPAGWAAKAAIIKMGKMGCLVAKDGEECIYPAFPVHSVDSTAAGDVFNGALAAALVKGDSFDAAVIFANAAAALSVTRAGAQPSIPNLAEVNRFLQEHS